MLKTNVSLAIVVILGTLSAANPALGAYVPGFIWQRSVDWTPGTVHGGTAGNPGPDAMNNPVWNYEYAKGNGLFGANPWYAQAATPMVWDSAWLGGATSVWSAGNDKLPAIDPGLLYESTLPGWLGDWQNSPVVRWDNPTNVPLIVSVQGRVTVGWTTNAHMDVDLVIAEVGAGGTDWLYRQTLSRPTGLDSVTVSLTSILPEIEGDGSIILSIRPVSPTDTGQASFVYLNDTNMVIEQISEIPEPATMALLAVGGGIVALRRRRRQRA